MPRPVFPCSAARQSRAEFLPSPPLCQNRVKHLANQERRIRKQAQTARCRAALVPEQMRKSLLVSRYYICFNIIKYNKTSVSVKTSSGERVREKPAFFCFSAKGRGGKTRFHKPPEKTSLSKKGKGKGEEEKKECLHLIRRRNINGGKEKSVSR